MAVFNATLAGKRIELTKELIPPADVVGYLLNPADQRSAIESEGALAAARALGIELKVLNASSEDELETAIAAVAICVLARSLSPANHFSTASAKGS
jgi:ABC-type uncharacterized transport system substrate-binding protein